jgi:hypothetical protein
MSPKITIGDCVECRKPFEESDPIWVLRGNPYHTGCIRKNRTLFELWKATDWRQKEILQ